MTYDFSAVRLNASHKQPYLAAALFAMHAVPTTGLGTMACDKWARVYYDPELFKRWTVHEAAWTLLHEVGHWVRKHHARAENLLTTANCVACAKLELNLCQDAEINDDLAADGAPPPRGEVFCHIHVRAEALGCRDGGLFEEYYAQISRRPRTAEHVHEHINCGSAAHGYVEDYELPPPVGDVPGIRDAEGDLLRRQIAEEVASSSRGRSSAPGGWVRWAHSLLKPPRVAWQQELGAHLRMARAMAMGAVDYSYRKRSRRAAAGGVIRPALCRPVPDVAVVLDTSGSMREADLVAGLSEVSGIVRATGQQQVPVICCDAQAAPVQRVHTALRVELVGGGGTDMGAGIAAAEQIDADVVIVLTDGFTPWPDKAPRRAEVVVGLIGPAADGEPAERLWEIPAYIRRVVHIPSEQESDDGADK
jgi:predicted metal-dependent peptidase